MRTTQHAYACCVVHMHICVSCACAVCMCCMHVLYVWAVCMGCMYGRMYGYTFVVFMLQKNSVSCTLFFYANHMVVQVFINKYVTLLLVNFVHKTGVCAYLQVVFRLLILKIFCRCFFNKSMFFFSLCCYVF